MPKLTHGLLVQSGIVWPDSRSGQGHVASTEMMVKGVFCVPSQAHRRPLEDARGGLAPGAADVAAGATIACSAGGPGHRAGRAVAQSQGRL